MPLFSYTAISQDGKTVSGEELAKNKRELARKLRERDSVLTSAEPAQGEEQERWWENITIPILSGVSVTDKLIFVRNLRVMVSAGVPLPRSLSILEEQTDNLTLKKALGQMQESIVKGEKFSDVIGAHPAIFSELFQSMVQVGEESGTLEEVLEHLELQLGRAHDLRSKIKGALVYPAVVVTAMIGIGILMLVLVVPQLAETFRDLGVDLPLTTKFVIGMGEFLKNFWYAAIGGAVLLALLFRYALKTDRGKRILDAAFLKLPIISGIVHKMNSAIIVRTLSSLIAAGVPLLRALDITSHTVGNRYFQESLESSVEQVRKGSKLSDALAPYDNLYPVIVIQMVRVGEETGQTSEILAKLAEFFEEEVTNATKNLASVIEPVLMLIIGAVVGFFAISMVQPMYSMLQGVQ